MKKFFFVFSLLIITSSYLFSQTDVYTELLISDNGGSSKVLIFGLDSTATDGIDPALGESDLPPFPPAGTFEARFFLPENGFLGTLGSYQDYRQAFLPYTGQKEFRLAYQLGTGTQITVFWNFPANVTGLLQDIFGGVLINVNMTDSGSYAVMPGIDRLKMLINYEAIIPVELVSFGASVQGNMVNLSWQTASELNNSGFEIQRKTESTNWNKIGFVEGIGTTTEGKSYSLTDTYSGQGTVSYRLKQIDLDGNTSYSKVINVNINAPVEYKLNQNYPNPFNPSTTICFAIPNATNVSLTIFNQIGEKVDVLVNNGLEAGTYNYTWNAQKQSSGIYFYELKTNEFVSVHKMALIK